MGNDIVEIEINEEKWSKFDEKGTRRNSQGKMEEVTLHIKPDVVLQNIIRYIEVAMRETIQKHGEDPDRTHEEFRELMFQQMAENDRISEKNHIRSRHKTRNVGRAGKISRKKKPLAF